MIIANHNLDEKVFVVAEIGVNHEGDFDTACTLVEKAAEANVDAVKFQTYLPHEYVTAADSERYARVGRFALSFEEFRKLADLAGSLGVVFFSTPLGVAGYPAEVVRRVVSLVDNSEYKRRQAPPGVKITPRALGRDRRMPITNRSNR